MQMASFFSLNKTELGLTPTTRRIILEQEKLKESNEYEQPRKRDQVWIKKTK